MANRAPRGTFPPVKDSETLLPLAIAAGGGSVDGIPAQALVAAGFTLLQRSAPLVRALSRKRAAILIPSSPAFITALAASDGRGAVLINPLAAPTEIAEQIADADVGAVFTVRALAGRLPAGFPQVLLDDAPRTAEVLIGDTPRTVDLGSHHGLTIEVESDAGGRDEECAVVFTSGMEGRALGARLSHKSLLANARQTIEAAAFTRQTHVLALLPFSHLFGLTGTLTGPLVAGGQVSTVTRFNPIVALERLATGDITFVSGVPAIFAGLMSVIERKGGRVPLPESLLCICGGAPLAVELQDRWFDATGLELRQGYGLTECAPVALFNRVGLPNRRGTLGVAMPGCEVTIRDPDAGHALPDGSVGEICVRGPSVFSGYVKDGAAGLQVRDGWLHTGDRGTRNDDGTVRFLGLIKPMFTRSGFNIYPREVERVIGEMPGVRTVRASAIPEPSRENDIAVEITGTVTDAEVKGWCEGRLSAYKQPSVITILG
jgi:long-chain acyl-CoA synthetase